MHMLPAVQVELSLQNPTNCPPDASVWLTWMTNWLTQLGPCDPIDGLPLHPQHHYELALRLTNDAEIQQLNHQFRAQDQPTDVLAFAALEGDPPMPVAADQPIYLGDLVISVETAQRQAIEQGHSLATELAWLATHGLLHLLGWDHPDSATLTVMLAEQRRLLQIAGII